MSEDECGCCNALGWLTGLLFLIGGVVCIVIGGNILSDGDSQRQQNVALFNAAVEFWEQGPQSVWEKSELNVSLTCTPNVTFEGCEYNNSDSGLLLSPSAKFSLTLDPYDDARNPILNWTSVSLFTQTNITLLASNAQIRVVSHGRNFSSSVIKRITRPLLTIGTCERQDANYCYIPTKDDDSKIRSGCDSFKGVGVEFVKSKDGSSTGYGCAFWGQLVEVCLLFGADASEEEAIVNRTCGKGFDGVFRHEYVFNRSTWELDLRAGSTLDPRFVEAEIFAAQSDPLEGFGPTLSMRTAVTTTLRIVGGCLCGIALLVWGCCGFPEAYAESFDDEVPGFSNYHSESGCISNCRPIIYVGCCPCLVVFFIRVKCFGPCCLACCDAMSECFGAMESAFMRFLGLFEPCCEAICNCFMFFLNPIGRCLWACCKAIGNCLSAIGDCIGAICNPLCACLAPACELFARFGRWFYETFFAPLVSCVGAILRFIRDYFLKPIWNFVFVPIGRAFQAVGRGIGALFR